MRRVLLLYPTAFAAAAVVRIAAANGGQYRGVDLALTLLTTVVIAAIATALALVTAHLVRGDSVVERATPIAAIALGWFFYFFPLQSTLSLLSWRLSRAAVVVPIGLLVSLAAVTWVLRQSADRLRSVNRFAAAFAFILLAFGVIGTVTADGAGSKTLARSALARELAVPIRAARTPATNVPPRDIYLILLDGHSNARVRRDILNDSVTWFEDSLRALGFVIPPDAKSNYLQTILSLPSILNFNHVTRIANDAGARSTDYSLPKFLIENNRAARFLKSRGYKYLLFPSAWWDATQYSPLADSIWAAPSTFNVRDALRRTELRSVVWGSTLLRPALRKPKLPDLRKFESLERVPSDTAPTFAFVHMLLPHLPFVYDANCQPLAQPITDSEEKDSPAQRAAYLAQMRCVDRLTVDAVRTILARSSTPPVILILGDHGSRFSDVRFYEHPESVSREFVQERFGAFAAAYLPDGGGDAFERPITLVNVLRHVLSYYFGADLPPLPDDQYVSGERPYQFYPLSTLRLGATHP